MEEIQLSQGYKAQIDDEDYGRVIEFKWHAQVEHRRSKKITNVYAVRGLKLPSGKYTTQKMHRFILGLTDPKVQVDHFPDPNGLNNRRTNLRITNHQGNQRTRGLDTTNTSGYKGLYWDKRRQKWRVRIVRKDLGYFSDPKEAALAYDVAAREHFGEFAYLNFP
jgi:hypothetical protein